ncbi:PREDICTED: uncharacterized protein LOC107165867 isoform X2 [Diuraphis noxia]|nr:PREDICTED: uncharacterized protein LOC107165867 isoform X2 [Diuraphis noxia]
MPGQLSVWPVCLFSVNKPEIGRIKNSHTSSKRCNEARRMSEGGLVMSTCAAANFNNNNNNNNNTTNTNNNNHNGVSRTTAALPRRKFSFPAVLQSHNLQSELVGVDFGGGPSLTVATARRRFSNVSDVVSRKLSHTIGWRTAVPTEQIARQGKALCVQYIRWKLKRAGAYTKKCAGALRAANAAANPTASVDGNSSSGSGGYFIPPLQAMASAAGAGADHIDGVRRDVFPAVLRVGLQLERLDPKLYAAGTVATDSAAVTAASVAGAAGNPSASAAIISPASSPQRLFQRHRPTYKRNTAAASVVLVSVSRELFRAGAQVTWAKVVSLVCVAAGLAVDCARRGRADQLPDLIEAVGEVIEDDLAAWIHYNGGWMGLQSYCKPVVVNIENPVSTQILYLVSLLILVIFFLLFLRWFNFISVFR